MKYGTQMKTKRKRFFRKKYSTENYVRKSKTFGNRKKRMCVRLRSGDKHHLRKPADRKAQTSLVSGTNVFLICAFRSENFLRWCLSPERNLTHNLFFLFPIVFGINLIHFFDEKNFSDAMVIIQEGRDGKCEGRNEKCEFWQGKVWTPGNCANFWQGKAYIKTNRQF